MRSKLLRKYTPVFPSPSPERYFDRLKPSIINQYTDIQGVHSKSVFQFPDASKGKTVFDYIGTYIPRPRLGKNSLSYPKNIVDLLLKKKLVPAYKITVYEAVANKTQI